MISRSSTRINRNVPPELESIVNRALARDRTERYSSARELGQDLSRFMFRFAQPVSGYDIATIVQATMREKEIARLAQGSFIHKLIEEALFEFTGSRTRLVQPRGVRTSFTRGCQLAQDGPKLPHIIPIDCTGT